MENFKQELLSRLNGAKKIVFMGIGEEKLTDDGVAPYIISELLNYSNDKILFINAKIDPMSRIDQIIEFNPSHLIIIDTCTLSEPPGTVTVLERKNFYNIVPISTHTIPIHIVIDLLVEKLPNLNVFMIGIVPESLEGFSNLILYKEKEFSIEDKSDNIDLPFFKFQLTKTIKKVAEKIIKIIVNIINDLGGI